MRVDQFLPNFARHDAIGNHVLALRAALRAAGIDSDIWADVIHRGVAGEARPYLQHPGDGGVDSVDLYHASTDSPMAVWHEQRAAAGGRLFLNYHNITPAEYFARWEPAAADGFVRARRQLADLARGTELAVADSDYNEAELRRLGYRTTAVAPPLVDLAASSRRPRPVRRAGGARWLFVGRLAPNKCQHDVIGGFAVYRRSFDPAARLVLAGSPSSHRYLRALQDLVAGLSLDGSVTLAGGVSARALRRAYERATVFVCCSEHEGFCVPVVEAMGLGVPVVAYRAAAVPETVGDAGVLLDDKDPLTVAVAVADVLADRRRRDAHIAAGRERARQLSLPATAERLVGMLAAAARRGPAAS